MHYAIVTVQFISYKTYNQYFDRRLICHLRNIPIAPPQAVAFKTTRPKIILMEISKEQD